MSPHANTWYILVFRSLNHLKLVKAVLIEINISFFFKDPSCLYYTLLRTTINGYLFIAIIIMVYYSFYIITGSECLV